MANEIEGEKGRSGRGDRYYATTTLVRVCPLHENAAVARPVPSNGPS